MSEDKSFKDCPFCGEEILKVAVKCKHCQTMLDGSIQQNNVTITKIDPFAEYQGEIKPSKGEITGVGVMGIILGVIILVLAFYSLNSGRAEAEGIGMLFFMGLFFIFASYMWARSPSKK